MATKTNLQRKSFATMLSTGGALVAVAGLIYLFFTPKTYEASVRIRLRNWVHADTAREEQGVDVSGQCQMIRSNEILDETVHNLDLTDLWGRRLNQGAPLKPEQCRLLLITKLNVRPGPRTSMIQIAVSGSDPDEAAKIANEIARLYKDKQQMQRRSLSANRLTQFKSKWEEQDKKVREAQESLEKLYLEITRNRTTNPAAIHDMVLSNQIQIESQYVAQRDDLARLKMMTPDQLKQVLPMLETGTNSPLTAALVERSKARMELVSAQSTYAADAPEVKNAAAVLVEIDRTIDRTIAGIMTAREKKVVSLKATMDEADKKLQLASAGINLTEIIDQNTAFAQAQQNLTNLISERDALQEKMAGDEVHDVLMPAHVEPEIIDPAEPPSKPTVPDVKLAAATIVAGSLAAVAGLVLLLLPRRPQPPRRLQAS